MLTSAFFALVLGGSSADVQTATPVDPKIVSLPEDPPSPEADSEQEQEQLGGPVPLVVEFAFPGPFQQELTYSLVPRVFERIASALQLDTEQKQALEAAFARYSSAIAGLPDMMAKQVGTEQQPFEGLTPDELEVRPDAQARLVEARAKAGREADNRMASALDSLSREAFEVLKSDAKSDLWRDAIRRWRRDVLSNRLYQGYASSRDFATDVDLTDIARRLARATPGVQAVFSDTSDLGVQMPDAPDERIRACQKGVRESLAVYADAIDKVLLERWSARVAWRSANGALLKGDSAPRQAELERARKRWLVMQRATEVARDQVAVALRAADLTSAEEEWTRSVYLGMCPALYGVDTLDLMHRWLKRRGMISAESLESFEQAYAKAVARRAELRPLLVKEMIAAVTERQVSPDYVGVCRQEVKLPRFQPLMASRNAACDDAIRTWRTLLTPAQVRELDSKMDQTRLHGTPGGALDY